MKKVVCISACITTIAFVFRPVQAQYYYNKNYYEGDVIFETGIAPGLINCFTDIGGKSGVNRKFMNDLNWENSKPCLSLYVAALYRYAFTGVLTMSYGNLQAYDSVLKNKPSALPGRYERNLSFKTSIAEVRLSVEAHPIYIFGLYRSGHAPRVSPYLSCGLGFFHFNPKAAYGGKWYALHPLHTEGQGVTGGPGKPYSLNQLNIAPGAGIRYELSDLFNVHVEIIHRILFTDYLDDVSTSYADPSLFFLNQPSEVARIAYSLSDRRRELDPLLTPVPGGKRGDPANKDSFFSIQLKVGVVLGRVRTGKY